MIVGVASTAHVRSTVLHVGLAAAPTFIKVTLGIVLHTRVVVLSSHTVVVLVVASTTYATISMVVFVNRVLSRHLVIHIVVVVVVTVATIIVVAIVVIARALRVHTTGSLVRSSSTVRVLHATTVIVVVVEPAIVVLLHRPGPTPVMEVI